MRPVELGYVAAGQGPTVVAMHGGLLSGRLTFGPVLADWAQRLRVLLPDRRGFERTPGVAGTVAEQARDLEAFIDSHAGGRAHVVGFSFGGVVALTALQLARRVFASLTVIEAPAVTLCGRDPQALALRARLADLYDTAIDGDARTATRDFFTFMDPRAGGRLQALLDAGDPGVHVVLDELRVWHTPLSPVGLAGVDVPTLVVSGARSPDAIHRVGELVAGAVGGRHHVQAASGHAAHLIGRPFRDLLCAHVADVEAARSWDDPVVLAPWDPMWRDLYEHERAATIELLRDGQLVDVAHVGSTAVDGLEAKPIVDLMVGVNAAAAIRPTADRLRALGYGYRDDPGSDNDETHMFLLRRADGRRLVHAHVVEHGSRWWHDHVAFRDLLRDDADRRRRYQTLKRTLADRLRDDREAYTEAKTAFVTAALGQAESPTHEHHA